jgi:hypothetical protein
MVRLSFSLHTEQPLHFTDVHGYYSATRWSVILPSVSQQVVALRLVVGFPVPLTTMATPTLPMFLFPTAGNIRFKAASHVHGNGLYEGV